MKNLMLGLCVSLLIVGCVGPSLDGRWAYRNPNGQYSDFNIRTVSRDEVYLQCEKNLLSGVYEHSGSELTLIRPDNPRAKGLKLRVLSKDELLVIDEPPTSLTGQKNMAGTLLRQ